MKLPKSWQDISIGTFQQLHKLTEPTFENNTTTKNMENKNKQTAVDWLEKNISLDMNPFELIECFNKAKEIEKQQIMDDFNNGVNDECLGKNTTAEQYYNEEYGK